MLMMLAALPTCWTASSASLEVRSSLLCTQWPLIKSACFSAQAPDRPASFSLQHSLHSVGGSFRNASEFELRVLETSLLASSDWAILRFANLSSALSPNSGLAVVSADAPLKLSGTERMVFCDELCSQIHCVVFISSSAAFALRLRD